MPARSRTMAWPDWFTSISATTYLGKRRFVPYSGGVPPWPSTYFNEYRNVVYPPPNGHPSRGLKQTSDETHPQWRRILKAHSHRDMGGNFTSSLKGVFCDGRRRRAWGETSQQGGQNQYQYEYLGPFLACSPLLIPQAPDHSDLNAMGATAIARCKPTNSIANVSTTIGELFREGLPKLFGATFWEDKAKAAKQLGGGEYLNHQFGWVPLVSDIKSVAYAAANADTILSQYERNAGRDVRRRYAFPTETSVVEGIVGPSNGFVQSPGWNDSALKTNARPMPNLRYRTRTEKSVWFSGAFTYHLPSGYKSRNGLRSAAAKAGPLIGLELTPEVVWNLTPWSWAIDWFSNAGDVVSNLSDWATDGLAMRYGYIMEHSLRETTYYLDGPSQYKFTDGLIPGEVVVRYETKRRRAAEPFGFGVSWEGMTPRQLAITAALGITRVFR